MVRCSFHVFVAYRVYSPIRFAVSMGTRGKTYRFSLWTPLKEENSFKNPLAPLLSPFLSSSLSPGSLSFLDLFPPFGFSFLFIFAGLSSPEKKRAEGGKKTGKNGRDETKGTGGRGNAPLKEVYFANKTGLVLCLLKQ